MAKSHRDYRDDQAGPGREGACSSFSMPVAAFAGECEREREAAAAANFRISFKLAGNYRLCAQASQVSGRKRNSIESMLTGASLLSKKSIRGRQKWTKFERNFSSAPRAHLVV